MWRVGVVQGVSQRGVGGPIGVLVAGSSPVAETPLDVLSAGCVVGSFIERDPTIGPERALLTSRAARWVTIQVGKLGRSVDEVATETDRPSETARGDLTADRIGGHPLWSMPPVETRKSGHSRITGSRGGPVGLPPRWPR